MEIVDLLHIAKTAVNFFLFAILGLFGLFLTKRLLEFINFTNLLKKRLDRPSGTLFLVRVPETSEKKEGAMEKALVGVYNLLHPHDRLLASPDKSQYLSLEILTSEKSIRFLIWTPTEKRSAIESQIFAQYPDAEIEKAKDYVNLNLDKGKTAFTELKLAKSGFLPIKTYSEFDSDPLSTIASVLEKAEADEQVWFQITLKPANKHPWLKGFLSLQYLISGRSKAGLEKMQNPAFWGKIRLLYLAENSSIAQRKLSDLLATLKQFRGANSLKKPLFPFFPKFLEAYKARIFRGRGSLFSPKELATLFHFPYVGAKISRVVKVVSRKAEPPWNLPKEGSVPAKDLSIFAETTFRNERIRFGIKREDRRRHLYVVGKTGMGKSKLLALLVLEDIKLGKGLALLDPHGDLAEELIKYIPQKRIYDVVYFNPADSEFPIGFNPLEAVESFKFKQNIVAGFIAIFKKLFSATWNQRLEHILRYTTLALLDYPGATVLGITRMLTDNVFRQKVIGVIKDPLVKKFWTTEFASWNDQFANEAIVPIINKVGQFVASPVIRNIVGQEKGGLNISEIMNKEKILIINLSMGEIGEENSVLLGSMLVTKIWQSALERAAIEESERKDFYLYVDEFQNFATSAFANILSEARKYFLNLTIAHQHIAQLPDKVKSTIFGNVGSIVSFRVGGEDAAILEKEFQPIFGAQDLMNLDLRNICIKMSIQGATAPPFSAYTIDFPEPDENYSQEVIKLSRERWAKPRKEVEKEIERWEQMVEGKRLSEKPKFTEPIV